MSKYAKIFLVIAGLSVIGGLLIYLLRQNGIKSASTPEQKQAVEINSPVFMTEKEKASFGLPSGVRAQVINRDQNGSITVYKLIKKDSDVIPDPSKIGPISPQL